MAAVTTPVGAWTGVAVEPEPSRPWLSGDGGQKRLSRIISLLARPERNSAMSSAVTISGCERTRGKILGRPEVVNRDLGFFQIFSQLRQPHGRSLLARDCAGRVGRSQHVDRVDVDGQLDAVRRRDGCRHGPGQRLEGSRVRASELDVKPIEVPDLEDRCRSRSEDPHRRVGLTTQGRRQILQVSVHDRFLRPPRDQSHQPPERGHPVFLPLRQLMGDEGQVVVPDRRADRGMLRRVGLHQHPAGTISTPRPTGHLRHRAGRSARRPGSPADAGPCRR